MALAAILLLAGAATVVRADDAGKTIRLAVVKATVLAPSLLIGKYLPDGWKTEITYFTSPSDMTNALLTDNVDLAYIGLTVGIVARSKDQPIIIVANQAGKGTAIVARADSAIHGVADLKGKRVGYLPLSIHDILLREEMKKAGLGPTDLDLIRLNLADMPAALQRGDIDAFSGNEPNATVAVMKGYGRVISYPYDNPVGTINVGVLSTDRIAHDKPELMRLWAGAHAKATDQLAKDPDGWADLVSKEWGYDRAATRRSIDNIEMTWRLDATFEAQLAAYMDRLKSVGVIARVPDEKTLVVSRFIDAVHP
jgi:NitT/TauT family transport system substrate-binding protein